MSKKVVVRARKKGTNKVVLSDIADVKEKSTPIIEDRGTEESELKGVEQFSSEEQSTAVKQEPEQVKDVEQGVVIEQESEQVEGTEQGVDIKQEPEQVEDILQSDLEEQSIDIEQEPDQVENIEQIEDKKLNKKSKNSNLSAAKKAKNDEFYTTLSMIENELSIHQEYKEQFRDMTILCNCDDPFWSDFYEFFKLVAVSWGIKRLIFTSYKENTTDDDKAFVLDWDRTKDKIITTTKLKPRVHELKGNGDFASAECIEYLKQSDIVVTNPPFSKFRQFFDLLMEYKKDFVLVAPVGALSYKNIFSYINDGKVNVGYMFGKQAVLYSESMFDEEVVPFKLGNICFITTLNLDKRKEFIPLNCLYYGNEEKYPTYVNYPAINVDKVKDIPKDYYGVMGVPVTFLGSYNSEQFKIVGYPNISLFPDGWQGLSQEFVNTYNKQNPNKTQRKVGSMDCGFIDSAGRAIRPYVRILIQRRFYLSDDIEFNYYNIAIDYCIDYSIGVIETTMITVENECISLQDSLADYTIQTDCIFDNEQKYMYELSRKG